MDQGDRFFADIRTAEEFEGVRRDEARLGPGVRAVLGRHGLQGQTAVRFTEGSLPVYAVGPDLVLKLYPPLYASERDREALVLSIVEARLPIPTPGVHAAGDLDGWAYLLMTRLHGEPLAAVWPSLGSQDRARLARQLGEALAVMHALRDPRSAPLRNDWRAFLDAQRAACVERQRMLGLDPLWLDQIPAFLDRVELGEAPPHALLHTEIMREHLLASRREDGWRLSGLFDFEPAMVGAPEYEFASVGVFFSCGEGPLLREALRSYGYAEKDLAANLAERCLAYGLLHRYSNIPWFLRRVPPPAGTVTLSGLARTWWGC